MKPILCFLLFVLAACTEEVNDDYFIENSKSAVYDENRLDTIVGDKVISAATNEIRKNNFESLKEVSVSDLKRDSKLYDIIFLGENNCLLRQKKSYSTARLFNVLLETKNDKVINYFVLNDFRINDIVMDGESFLILSDDFKNENIYWTCKLQMKIIKLNLNFNYMWDYQVSYRSPLETVKIESSKNYDTYTINVITGCHICYSIVELKLSKTGGFISVNEIELHNSQPVPKEQLKAIFNKENL
jgi:hypothetical protein